MKRLLVFFALSAAAFAQLPASVQQSASRLDVGLFTQTVASTGTTITLTPPAGQSVYVTQIDFSNCQDATGVAVAVPTFVTSTNLGGILAAASLSWMMASGVNAGVGSCVQTFSVTYPTGLKALQPGTPVTIIEPAFASHQTIRVTVTYFFAP